MFIWHTSATPSVYTLRCIVITCKALMILLYLTSYQPRCESCMDLPVCIFVILGIVSVVAVRRDCCYSFFFELLAVRGTLTLSLFLIRSLSTPANCKKEKLANCPFHKPERRCMSISQEQSHRRSLCCLIPLGN